MKKIWFLTLLLLTLPLIGQGQVQKKQKAVLRIPIAFYNVENMFDAQKGPNNDIEFTPNGSNRWTQEKYERKLHNIARVISEIGGHGPAVMGLAEVENRGVVEALTTQPAIAHHHYQIVHYESPDKRGIDCALIYNPDIFKLCSSGVKKVDLGPNGWPTRDVLFASGTIDGEMFHFIVCHWPSRAGGETVSAPRRMQAALTTKHVADSLLSAHPGSKVIMMGDLNDDPVSPSVRKGIGIKNHPDNLAEKDYFTPMLRIYNKGLGTLAYRDAWNLFDIMIVNGALLGADRNTFKLEKDPKTGDYAHIFRKDYLVQQDGNYKGYPYRMLQGGRFQKDGYSDHFPVYLFLTKAIY